MTPYTYLLMTCTFLKENKCEYLEYISYATIYWYNRKRNIQTMKLKEHQFINEKDHQYNLEVWKKFISKEFRKKENTEKFKYIIMWNIIKTPNYIIK